MAEVTYNEDELVTVTHTGENLVKLSRKMSSKLKSFLKKVRDGITTVPYVPGAIFEIAKLRKEEKQAEKTEEKAKSEFGKRVDEIVKKFVEEDEKKRTAAQNRVIDEDEKVAPRKATENTQPVQAASEEVQPKEPTKKIQGKTVADLLKGKAKDTEEAKTKENEPIKPETVEIEPESKHPEEEKPKKEKKDLKDLTAFDTYQDYKFAYFWNYKMNKYDADVLEKVAKDYAKEADATRFRTLLTEADFNEKKAEQVKAKEIADIEKAHQEEMAAAEEKRQADVQAAIDQRQAEVDELNEKLTTARSKNRTLTSKLKVDNEALEKIKEAVAPLGIAKIDEIISKATEKCQGIDDRAAEREKAKEESKPQVASAKDFDVDAETDRIMKQINESVYGPKEEAKTENKAEVEPQVEEKSEEAKETEMPSASTESEAVETKEEPTAAEDNNSLVNELASYDEEPKEVTTPSVFDTVTPKVELEPEPFTPSWKLGSVENQMNAQNNAPIDFNQIVDESSKSKGKTR